MSEFSLEPKNGDYASLVEKKGLYDKKMLEAQIRNAMLLQQQKSDKLEKLEQDALNKLKDNKLSINKEIKKTVPNQAPNVQKELTAQNIKVDLSVPKPPINSSVSNVSNSQKKKNSPITVAIVIVMFFAFFLGALFDTGAVPVLIAFPLIIGLICYSHKYNKLNNHKG
ncbi:MAG: hypothetical protein SPK02_03555 [Succinivibrio sp.]|nr:hypothetical protein [Succinivibrio sp.]MDY5905020.1 hypothetical protein [Succinivibrio sp.]HAO92010.1 hypothetical protein [Succinivibrio sp.]